MRLEFVLTGVLMFVALVSGELRIVNGSTVSVEFKYQWMVAIFRYDSFLCGGTLINYNKVITAAHCMSGARAPLDTFEVHLHRHNIGRKPEEEKAIIHKVTRRWVADNYDASAFYNDVVILEIDASGYQPAGIRLDWVKTHPEGEHVIVIGWGAMRQGGKYAAELQEVSLPLISNSRCASLYQASDDKYQIKETQICTLAGLGDKDACQGDSGGPLFTILPTGPLLIGVVSSGFNCADIRHPGVSCALC
ncbi:Transmembrane protease serine 6 [Entomophthora muscae]|uniref:Transmembrane protease serine 6 n=1 Tax=Entomophthora muscae TaxID=34485 RepID=A0ACC2TBI5_9FUNG|nr:Transmembrane protease serine 6 [Entomophthora muscae]